MHSDRPILRASVAPWGSGISFKYDKRSLNEYIANPARLTTQKSTDSTVGRTPCGGEDGGGRFRCWSSTAKVTTCRIGLIGKGARDGIVKKWIWWSDSTNALKRLGMRTISSIGLSPGNVWRDRMVYDSSLFGSSACSAKRMSSPLELPT